MTQDERRREQRIEIAFPLKSDCGRRKERIGIVRNTNAFGMLFFSRSAFEIGDTVELRLLLPGRRGTVAATGRVVRKTSNPDADLWFNGTAVVFDDPVDDVDVGALAA